MKVRTVHTLGKVDVQHHIGNTIVYQRGLGYCRSGRVLHLEIRDDRLLARVSGSYGNTYQVEAWCDEGELMTTCTCPYVWGPCKHIAATLCAWLDRRADPRSYTTTTPDRMRARLQAIPPPVLIDLLIDECRLDVLLERYIKRWVEKTDPERLPRLVSDLLRRARPDDPDDIQRALDRLNPILDWSESWPPDQALNLASEIIKKTHVRPDIAGHPGTAHIMDRAFTILTTRARQCHLDGTAERSLLKHVLRLTEYASAEWDLRLTDTLLELSARPPSRQFLIDEVKRKAALETPPMKRLLAGLYKHEGRMEEYERARVQSLVHEADYVELFEYYVEDNRPDKAMTLGEQGMTALGACAPRLAGMLTDLYLEWGERELARQHLIRWCECDPSDRLIHMIDSLSHESKNWEKDRIKLEKRLAAKP